MTNKICLTMLIGWLSTACAQSAQPAQAQQMPKGTNTNPDAQQVADFLAKVGAYNTLRAVLAKDSPPLKETTDPGAIGNARSRSQPRSARRGRTPGAATSLHRPPRPCSGASSGRKSPGAPTRPTTRPLSKEDAPKPGEVPFKVNGEYPKDAPLSTVPPDVLKALPSLPENLQYRFVGRHLILYCTNGNLIVDYMLNALP